MSQIIKPQNPRINWGNPLSKGIIFDVPMFEKGGSNVLDIVSNVTGNYSGSSSWVNTPYGTGISFNGSSQYIEYPNRAQINTSIFSIFALVYTTDNTLSQFILGPDVNKGIGFTISNPTSTKLGLLQSGFLAMASSTTVVPDNKWTLVGVTYDQAGNYVFYIDGQNAGSGTNAQTFPAFIAQIGVERISSPAFFSGKMAFVRMWNRVLSPSEVKQLSANPFQIYQQPSFPYANAIAAAVQAKLLSLLGVG